MHGDKIFGTNNVATHQNHDRRDKKAKRRLPRSSSPVTVYVDTIPCIVEEAFATIAWDDLEDCTSVIRRESDSIGSQVIESDGDEDFGDYALDFIADSPSTLESNLSPAGLVAFQGCIIPPLTPGQDLSAEDSLGYPPPALGQPHVQDRLLWRDLAQHRTLEALETNSQLHLTLHRKQEEIDSLQERNVHLRELASRAKHLVSVLDSLVAAKEPCLREASRPFHGGSSTSKSPCKRPRLDEECETARPGCVEDILRDVSERCNAVLHRSAEGLRPAPGSEIRMVGSFPGLQIQTPSASAGNALLKDAAEAGESDWSFRTSVREHCTIRTQTFAHGHTFTSRTPQGGYRFRWVPNQS